MESELKSFLEKDYYYTATVLVSLDTVNPTAVLKKISISGEVRAPGPIEVAAGETPTLPEVILPAANFTQWAKKDIKRVGMLKMDFLSLSTLTLIDDCVK